MFILVAATDPVFSITKHIKPCFCFTQATEEQRKKIATEFQNFVKESINNSLPLVSTIAQQTIKFCCLSENINSTAMWGLYSNDETGFALAYDLRGNLLLPLENGKIKNCSIYPIIYCKERFKVPTNYIQFLLYSRLMSICLDKMGLSNHPIKNLLLSCNVCPDITVPTKIALHKSSEWKYEKEWRLFYPSCGEQNYFLTKHEFFIKAPVAIYLGRRISHIYEKILKDIANLACRIRFFRYAKKKPERAAGISQVITKVENLTLHGIWWCRISCFKQKMGE